MYFNSTISTLVWGVYVLSFKADLPKPGVRLGSVQSDCGYLPLCTVGAVDIGARAGCCSQAKHELMVRTLPGISRSSPCKYSRFVEQENGYQADYAALKWNLLSAALVCVAAVHESSTRCDCCTPCLGNPTQRSVQAVKKPA